MSLRRIVYPLASSGVIIQATSGWWDVFSHRIEFIDNDPLFNPAHIGLYSGTLLLLPVFRFKGIVGLKMFKLFVALQIISGIMNEAVHRFPHLERMFDFLVHSIFTVAMLLASLTLFTSISIYLSIVEKHETHYVMSLVLSGAALWMISSGAVLYVFHRSIYFTYFMLGFITSIILITALSATKRIGTSVLITLIFSLIRFTIIVGYAGFPPYPTIAPAAALTSELIIFTAAKLTTLNLSIIIGGTTYGALTKLIYYPLLEQLQQNLVTYTLGALGGLTGSIPILILGEPLAKKYEKQILSTN